MDVYLKEVQMENFKSFGKKLTVPLFQGFTAVTGPNGSGKSNIVDAILFVLGPKSSKVMRAGRLTDLIFNGGKKHKDPAKYCKVSLVFDNSLRKMPVDTDEVVLTRMIKRAPTQNDPNNYYSYFYINDHAASLSDFTNLLNHARISGTGYNIVKQGDVTSLVEMGSIDRRRIIDGIAGISTFDDEIKKAEKEKIDAEGNLERISIILNEISNQIRQLKKERDQAYQYKEMKDKLYETKAKIAYKKKQEIESQIAEISNQIESYETERTKLEDQRTKLKEKYSESQKKLEEIEKKIGAAGGTEAQQIGEKITSLRTETIKIEEKINYTNDEILTLKNDEKEVTETLGVTEKELEGFRTQSKDFEKKIDEQQTVISEKDAALTKVKDEIAQSDDTSMELTYELVKMREEYNEKQTYHHDLQLKMDRLNEKLEAIELQIAEMQETKSTYEFELKDIDWQSGESTKGRQERQKTEKELEKQVFSKKKKETDLTEQLADLENAIRRLQREQAKIQAETEALKSANSKFNPAVNAILSARNAGELKGIRGTIAELAEVDKKYEAAMEIAAGNRLQSIVVDNDETAASAIEYLRKKNLGRATFLPLNKMSAGKPRGNALMVVRDPTSHGFAVDLVKFKPEYRGAFWYVLGDTIIVETLSDARRLMGGVRLVDMKGDLIEASGAMVGGSRPSVSPSFGASDQGKLEDITTELQSAITHQDELSNELVSLKKELVQMENELRSIKGEGIQDAQAQNLEVRRKEFKGKLDLLIKDLDMKTKEKDQADIEKNDLAKTISECDTRIQELNTQKEEKGQHLLKGTKKELAVETRTLEKEYDELSQALLTKRSDLETLKKKMELVEQRKTELTTRINSIHESIEQHKATTKELKESKAKQSDELKTLMNVEQQMTGKTKEFASKRDTIYKETITIENDLDKMNTRMESYQDLISRAKYRMPTLEDTIKELNQEIALYNISVSDKDLPNVEALKEIVLETEHTMQELEPVNMRALEEYEHQMERKKKFDEDVKHLNDQKKNLTRLVEEIITKKKERFFEVYDDINKNFKTIYGQLSEGGEAELELEDPEHLFENGLTIKARPRGKKILRLDALSGGEKSIASLGFVFAIQQYDPSPFYVLDEVDMFLDGVNAETVSKMIKLKAEHSQFITVSLRKVVLKEADHIYGVTMQETGVSQMIADIDPESVGPKGEIHTAEVITTHVSM